jgi:hypothetical protein
LFVVIVVVIVAWPLFFSKLDRFTVDSITNFQIRLQNNTNGKKKSRKAYIGVNVSVRLYNGSYFVVFYFDQVCSLPFSFFWVFRFTLSCWNVRIAIMKSTTILLRLWRSAKRAVLTSSWPGEDACCCCSFIDSFFFFFF